MRYLIARQADLHSELQSLNRRLDEIASQVCGGVVHESHKSARPDEPAPTPHMVGQLSNGLEYHASELFALQETVTFLENNLGVEPKELGKSNTISMTGSR